MKPTSKVLLAFDVEFHNEFGYAVQQFLTHNKNENVFMLLTKYDLSTPNNKFASGQVEAFTKMEPKRTFLPETLIKSNLSNDVDIIVVFSGVYNSFITSNSTWLTKINFNSYKYTQVGSYSVFIKI